MAVDRVTQILGPPATKTVTIITRQWIVQLLTFILVAVWVLQYLGGVALRPKELNLRANDTGGVFNWHPLLMALAFPVFMGEAVMAYRAPLTPRLEQDQRKLLHTILNALAVTAAVLGVIAAFNSHTLKRPVPTPNLYSPHSYLGIFTLVLLGMQFLLGFTAFFYPKYSKGARDALLPWHHFLGRATFAIGLATMAVGIQEKVGFVVSAKKLAGAGLYTGYVRLPAAIEIFLALTGMLVLYHHVPGSANRRTDESLLPDVMQTDVTA